MVRNTQQNKKLTETAPLRLNNEELQFPVTFGLKAVMLSTLSDTENKRRLAGVFDKLEIDHLYLRKNRSSKGTYVSFTYEVTLNDRQTMNRLYLSLKEIENLKFAL